jgi:hypothetical protein
MTRCAVVRLTVDGQTEAVRAQVADEFGSDAERAALAAIVSAGRRRWAAMTHPEHRIIACPRARCGAEAGADCTTARGVPLEWGHLERHAAAIAADGRTCADGGGNGSDT